MVILLISVTLLMSISQTLLYAWSTPAGTVYPLVHNFVEDYYQYLDILRQGYDGWWQATSRLTPEAYPRMVVSVFLLLLGHIARLLHISLPVAYTAARVLGGAALMVFVYQLIRHAFPESRFKRLVALCFILFGTYFWGWGSDGPTVAPLTHAWTELDPVFRWSFVPHHLWAKVWMVGAFLSLLLPRPALLIVFTVLMGFTNPVVYVTFIPTLLLYAVLSLRGTSLRATWQSLIAIGVALLIVLYHRYLQTNIFPWTSYLLWERTLNYNVHPLDYAMSFGPTLILFILAIPALWRLGRVGSLYIAWAASSWVMMYVAGPFVPVTPERSLGGYQFIPLGIGSALWIFSLKRPRLLRLGMILLLLIYFSIGLGASFKEHAGYVSVNRNNFQVYVPNELMAAFSFLSQKGRLEDVVMAPYEISTMIPAFTGSRVIAGHVLFTKDVGAKKALINEFFTGHNLVSINRILSSSNIRWVLSDTSFTPPQGENVRFIPRYRSTTYTLYRITTE